jgi:hypothetical protein
MSMTFFRPWVFQPPTPASVIYRAHPSRLSIRLLHTLERPSSENAAGTYARGIHNPRIAGVHYLFRLC